MRKPLLEKLIQEVAMFDMDAACKLHMRKDNEDYEDKDNLRFVIDWDGTKEGFDYWSDICDKLEARRKNYHPHRDLMIEYANNKTIEFEFKRDDGTWRKCEGVPSFFEFYEYRKKPKVTKKIIECRIYLDTHGEINIVERDAALNISNFKEWCGDWQKVEIEVQEND